MLKRIIFDMDNTLIEWKNEYWNSINKALDEIGYQYNEELIKKMIKVVDEYEKNANCYKKQTMLDFFNKYTNENIPIEFMDKWLYYLGKCAPKELEKQEIETLEYLNKKYELVILTNWFRSSQIERLKRAEIYQYFKEIFDGEEIIKPAKESFQKAMGDKNEEQCIMIGDDIDTDIKGATGVGIKAILIGKKDKEINCLKISRLDELKNIL